MIIKMCAILFITTALLSCHVANSYILLTANLEDFQAIARQIAASPVGNQIGQIVQRASELFNKELENKPQKRTDDKRHNVEPAGNSVEVWKPDASGSSVEIWKPGPMDTIRNSVSSDSDNASDKDGEDNKNHEENLKERRTYDKDLNGDTDKDSLGQNASYYLQSIKKIFDSV